MSMQKILAILLLLDPATSSSLIMYVRPAQWQLYTAQYGLYLVQTTSACEA